MDAAAVGGFFISAFLQVLFDRIAPREIWDFFRARKLDGLLSNLQITLIAVNKLIQDAENKQFDDLPVRQWLQKLQAVVYDAEDLLDAVNTEAMQVKLEDESSSQSKTSKLCRFFCSCTSQPARRCSKLKMETKLKEILQQLEYLVKQKDVLGLKEGVGQKASQRLQTTSLMGETIMYGRDGDKDVILGLLLSDSTTSENLDVITIKGMGGLGKTALAQLVYNDGKVKEHFGFRAWVCISEELDVFKVTRTILEAVSSSNSPSTNSLDLIQVELQKMLSEKKFLLVLDDVWNENRSHWEMLKKPLLHGDKGSKILVTTRYEHFAEIMPAVQTHNLQKLSEKDSWSLFAKQAFGDEDSHSPALQEIGRKIVEKCGGLPLAVKVLGGLLRYKRTPQEWVKVLESNMWELKDAKSDILPVLRVSYHFLPSHLKQCFAYSSIYPKDHEFEKEELIRLWMAQGFLLDPDGRKKMEEVGDEYFNDLVSRSFFQHSTARWKEEYFVMHDLINDLANFVSGQLCFCMQRGSTLQEVSPTTRHLSYSMRRLNQFAGVPEANCLRTFLLVESYAHCLYEEVVPNNLLQTLRLVRVLSLKGYKICELPESIANLKHLRYLDLSYTQIERLPDSVCNLYNLQTLLLRWCYCLIELPENMWKLVNLRYLDIVECRKLGEMPINMGSLKNLCKLDIFFVGKSSIKELGQLSELQGNLEIRQLQNVVCTTDAAEARLNDKKYLGHLNLEWSEFEHDNSQKEYDVLEKLQPHQNLKGLGITSYGGTRFPNWVGGPTYSNMEFIELKNCRYCYSLPTLGGLPSLKRLRIEGLSGLVEVGADFYENCTTCAFTPFESLEELSFSDMCEWEEWCGCDDEKAFPLLGVLVIEKCPKLKGDLPFCLPSLTKLNVWKCPALGGSLLPRAPLLEELKLCWGSMVWNEPLEGLKSLEMRDCNDEASECLLEKVMLTSTCLETLCLERCSSLTSLPEMNSTCHLKRLEINFCSSLTSLPEMNSTCPLHSLRIFKCSSLMCLPEKIGLLSSLKSLYIDCCEKLELPIEHQFASLEDLEIWRSCCDTLRSFPLNLFPKLRNLRLFYCENLESFSDSEALPPQGLLSQLTQLDMYKCLNLSSFSAQEFPFPNLRELSIKDCSSMNLLGEQQMQALSSPHHHLSVLPSTLTSIYISNCDKLVEELLAFGLISGLPCLTHLTIGGPCEGVKSFPQEGCLPTSLNSLTIDGFSDLETLQYKGLHNLTSLSSLKIWQCCKLRCLPQEGLPTSLSSLDISFCPLLEQRLQRDQGKEWDKIASIPHVLIDHLVVLK